MSDFIHGGGPITRSRTSNSRFKNVDDSKLKEKEKDTPVIHSSYFLRSKQDDTDMLTSKSNNLKVYLVVEMEREGRPPMKTSFDLAAKNLGANSDLESVESIMLEELSLGLRLRPKKCQNELNKVVWQPTESSTSSKSEITLFNSNYFTINWTSGLPDFKFKLPSKFNSRPKSWTPFLIFGTLLAMSVFLSLYGSWDNNQETTPPLPSNE